MIAVHGKLGCFLFLFSLDRISKRSKLHYSMISESYQIHVTKSNIKLILRVFLIEWDCLDLIFTFIT